MTAAATSSGENTTPTTANPEYTAALAVRTHTHWRPACAQQVGRYPRQR